MMSTGPCILTCWASQFHSTYTSIQSAFESRLPSFPPTQFFCKFSKVFLSNVFLLGSIFALLFGVICIFPQHMTNQLQCLCFISCVISSIFVLDLVSLLTLSLASKSSECITGGHLWRPMLSLVSSFLIIHRFPEQTIFPLKYFEKDNFLNLFLQEVSRGMIALKMF